jgi:CspA family cold shock protein
MTTVGYYQVKWFKKQSGFGFATDENGQDIFCHHSDIKIDGYK